MAKVLVGFRNTNEETLKYLIHEDLGGGLYRAERFPPLMMRPDGSQYPAHGKVQKVYLIDVKEEEVDV